MHKRRVGRRIDQRDLFSVLGCAVSQEALYFVRITVVENWDSRKQIELSGDHVLRAFFDREQWQRSSFQRANKTSEVVQAISLNKDRRKNYFALRICAEDRLLH